MAEAAVQVELRDIQGRKDNLSKSMGEADLASTNGLCPFYQLVSLRRLHILPLPVPNFDGVGGEVLPVRFVAGVSIAYYESYRFELALDELSGLLGVQVDTEDPCCSGGLTCAWGCLRQSPHLLVEEKEAAFRGHSERWQ